MGKKNTSPGLLKNNSIARRKYSAPGRNPSGLSVILKSLAYPLGFITVSLVVFFLVSNKDKLNTNVVKPGDDTAYATAMASYAGIGNPEHAELPDGPIPLDLMETFAWENYTVKKGDSISGIAASRSLSMDAIIALNGISNAKRLMEGSVIRIPNMDGIPYSVRKGDSLSGISAQFGVPLEAILDANDLETEIIKPGDSLFIPGARMKREELKKALGELFIYPIKGRLTSAFGWRDDPFTGVRRYHAAIDLAAPIGTPIKCSMDGKVSVIGTNATYGKYVIISHSDGYNTMYAHMNSISVSKGTPVLQGRVIGEVGNTGYSTGPHLHFAVFRNGKAMNPLEFLGL